MNWITENIALVLEIAAVIFGIVYVVLIAANKISCWFFGIIGSIISIYLFVEHAKLYAEAVLYGFYVLAGIYGWVNWKKQKEPNRVFARSIKTHLVTIAIGILLSLGLFVVLNEWFAEAKKPLIDSFTTIFSFIATYITTKKWIENWIYWIVIDAVTTYLYMSRGLEIYALLMLVYTIIAVYGYLKWRKLTIVNID